MYTYKFRIYPDNIQARTLRNWAKICRFAYNWLIDRNNDFYNENRFLDKKNYWIKHNEFFGYCFSKILSRAKKVSETSFFSQVPSPTLYAIGENLDLAWRSFFKRRQEGVGKPKKHKYKTNVSLYFHNISGILNSKELNIQGRENFVVRLAKLGNIQGQAHRSVLGRLMSATVSSQGSKWFVSLTTDFEPLTQNTSTTKVVGIDRGVTDAAVCSDGKVLSNIYTKDINQRIIFLQKKLSRQKFKSKNYNKTQLKIADLSAHKQRIRKDVIDNFSYQVTSTYPTIKMEKLDIKKMTGRKKGEGRKQKSRLNNSILNNCWGLLSSKIEEKSKRFDGKVQYVNPAYTSQTCPNCKHCDSDNRKGKQFLCKECGFKEDADLVGAYNILMKEPISESKKRLKKNPRPEGDSLSHFERSEV
jgi:putative transposase